MGTSWYDRLNDAALNPNFNLRDHIPILDLYAGMKDHNTTKAKITGLGALIGLAGLALTWERRATSRQSVPTISYLSVAILMFGYQTFSLWRQIKEVDRDAYNAAIEHLHKEKNHFQDADVQTKIKDEFKRLWPDRPLPTF